MWITSQTQSVGQLLFGALYATLFSNGPIGNFSVFLAIVCGVMNISSMWFVRPIPLRSEGDTKQQVKQVKRHTVSFYDDVNDGDSGTADDWHELLGINLLKVPAFHIFSWCFLLVAPLQATVFTNITTMAASFGHIGLLLTLPIYGSVFAFFIMPTVGLISDCTTKYVSRMVHIMMGVVLETLFFVLSIFWGDRFYFFFGLVLSAYLHTGILYSIWPNLIKRVFWYTPIDAKLGC